MSENQKNRIEAALKELTAEHSPENLRLIFFDFSIKLASNPEYGITENEKLILFQMFKIINLL